MPIPTAKLFIERLEGQGIPYLYLTNNATRTPEEVVAYLAEVCQIQATPDQVYTSGLAAVDYIAKNYPNGRVYVVGEAALARQVEEAGLVLVDEKIQVVLQALDRKTNYEKLTIASTAIRNGAAFVVTNPDTNLPTENGF